MAGARGLVAAVVLALFVGALWAAPCLARSKVYQGKVVRGRVVTVLYGGDHAYLEVARDGASEWVGIYRDKAQGLATGDTVEYEQGYPYREYPPDGLDRVFPVYYGVNSVKVVNDDAAVYRAQGEDGALVFTDDATKLPRRGKRK